MLVYGMCGTPQYKMKVWISEFNRLTGENFNSSTKKQILEKEKDSEEDEEDLESEPDLENPASLHSTRF